MTSRPSDTSRSKGGTVNATHHTSSSPQLADWKPGQVILDRYQVENVFSGAMGKVYIAEHLGWKVPMAIKAPRPEVLADKEGIKRILNEADNWVGMGMHPNVATCYYVLNINEVPHLFIEFVDGGDLSSWLKTGRCRDPRTALSLAIQFCHGMEFTHRRGIIHRDIKPANTLLTKNALLKITDFGIIATTKKPSSRGGLDPAKGEDERTIGFRGTPSYASPEQFRDTHSVDKRSDIFSFGVVLWLMFCGRRPYQNNAEGGEAVPSPMDRRTTFPPIMAHLLQKSVAFEPVDRYQSFAELRHDLNQAHITMFRVPCPYMELDFTDLQAENLNNRAVSFLELGKVEEGHTLLKKALDINDTLPEAIFNDTLFRWKNGAKPDRVLRQVEASKQRLPDAKMLPVLAQSLKCDILGNVWNDDEEPRERKQFYPEYQICLPRNSVDVFRASQLAGSVRANLKSLLKREQYEKCTEVLLQAWQNNGFRSDKDFRQIYEQLLPKGRKSGVAGVLRMKTMRDISGAVRAVSHMPGTKKIISIGRQGKVLIRTYKAQDKINVLGKYSATVMAISKDGQYLGLGDKNGLVAILSLKTGEELKSLSIDQPVTAMAFSPDGNTVAAGSGGGHIHQIPLAGDRPPEKVSPGGGAVRALHYFDKGSDFVSGSDNGAIRFWNTGEAECIRIADAHAMPVTSISAADNGLLFISGSADRVVKIWNRQTGQCMKTVEAHEDMISAVMVLQSSKYFVTASEDDILKIWDMSSGQCLQVLDGRGNGISSLCQGPRPNVFLAGCRDGSIIIWMVIYELDFS